MSTIHLSSGKHAFHIVDLYILITSSSRFSIFAGTLKLEHDHGTLAIDDGVYDGSRLKQSFISVTIPDKLHTDRCIFVALRSGI